MTRLTASLYGFSAGVVFLAACELVGQALGHHRSQRRKQVATP